MKIRKFGLFGMILGLTVAVQTAVMAETATLLSDDFESYSSGTTGSSLLSPWAATFGAGDMAVSSGAPSAYQGSNFLSLTRAYDGSKLYADFSSDAKTTGTVTVTLALYVPTKCSIQFQKDTSDSGTTSGIYITDGVVKYLNADNSAWIATSLTMPANAWQTMTLSYNLDTDVLSITVGSSTVTATDGGNMNSIGAIYFSPAASDTTFYMDEVAVQYTPTEIPTITTYPLLKGTYTYAVTNVGTFSSPVTYNAASALGDAEAGADTPLTWGNGSNTLGEDGATIIFDLGSSYPVQSIKTDHYIPAWTGVGPVDFYYSTNGTTYTSLGSNGIYESCDWEALGWRSRSVTLATAVTARYIKLQVHSDDWRNLRIDDVVIGTPTPVDTNVLVETKSGNLAVTGTNDLQMDFGKVHVNGDVYKNITLKGTITNWSTFTDSDWNGVWNFVTLFGSDYFANGNVPSHVDGTTSASVFAYADNALYGNAAQSRGCGADACLGFYYNTNTSSPAFAVEDCNNTTTLSGHKYDFGTDTLSDPGQFEFEVLYDLTNETMTARIRNVGDTSWLAEKSCAIGYRNIWDSNASVHLYDDMSDFVLSIQISDALPASSDTYGFNYSVQMLVTNPISGDANFDGVVDVGDLGILAANYGSTGKTWSQGDFNGDGVVDVGDLGILAANYGKNASAADFDADYAKVFGAESKSTDTGETAGEGSDSTICSSLGLSLISGLALMGLLLVKLEE